jgi:hypothetical protein
MSKFIHSVVIEHASFDDADLDDHGNPVPEAVTTTTVNGLVQPTTTISEAGDVTSSGSEIGDHVVFLPVGTDMRHADSILFDGGRYQIVGIRRYRYGGLAHLEVDCRLITATPQLVGS